MRKYVKISIVFCLLMSIFIGDNTIIHNVKATTQVSQSPIFHGTTKVELPLGSEFDIKHPYYRIFAIDHEDGDLTNQIQVLSNDVDPTKEGNYTITYRVTDSDRNTQTIQVPVYVSRNYTKISYERSLYNLATSENTDRIGFNRGNNHDAQQLGVFVKAGTTVHLEQMNPATKKNLKLVFYNDDNRTEVIKEDWNTGVNNQYDFINNGGGNGKDSVLLVYSTRGNTQDDRPILKVTIEDGMKPLMYYHDGDDQEAFLDEWNQSNDAFAFIETERTALILPKDDRILYAGRDGIKNGIGLEIDTESNGNEHRLANGDRLPRHASFVNTNEIKDIDKGLTHQQAQALPNELLTQTQLDAQLTLQWDATTKTLSYTLAKKDGSHSIQGKQVYQDIQAIVGDEGYFMATAGKGWSNSTFKIKLQSYQSNGETITDANSFFSNPIGDVAKMDLDGVVSLTDGSEYKQIQSGAIHSKQKINVTQDFTLTFDVNIPQDPDGIVFLLHNDPRGTKALSYGGRSLGAYTDSTRVNENFFHKLDDLLSYYNEFLDQYDRFSGLDVRAQDPIDKNIKSKYLVKANQNGAGIAYYGWDHTAQNGPSIYAYLERGWLVFHEFAHGYEGNLGDHGIYMQETLNNLFAYYYEKTFLKPGQAGWIGVFDQSEHSNFQLLKNQGYAVDNYGARLYFLVNMLDATGNPEEASAALHKRNRRNAVNGLNPFVQDLMADVWSDYAKHNYVPYIQFADVSLDEKLVEGIYEREYPNFYFLQELVGENMATQIKQDLQLPGELSLVDAKMLEPYNLKGNVNLTFTIDDFEAIRGKTANIKDGNQTVYSFTIDQEHMTLHDLPVGHYYLQLPITKEYDYHFDYTNVLVKANQTTDTEVTYRRISDPALFSDTIIRFKGISDYLYASLQLNPITNKIEIRYENVIPHHAFDSPYSSITITSPQGEQLYHRTIIGNQHMQDPKFEEIPYEIGTQIRITHAEGGRRFVPYSTLTKQTIDELQPTNIGAGEVYVVSPYGLMKKSMSKQEQESVYNKLLNTYFDDFVQFVDVKKRTELNTFHIMRGNVYKALLLTDEGKQLLADNIEMFLDIDKTPTVTITGAMEPIELLEKDDLYQYLDIVDYKGNKVPSNATYVTFTFPDSLQPGIEQIVEYTVKDDEGNTAQGTIKVILKDKTPTVTITGATEPIELLGKDDLYQYLDIVDYKGNKVPSNATYVTFTFPDSLQPGTEQIVEYTVKDDEGNTAQGTIKVILKDKTPTVTITGATEPIELLEKDDLYQYLDIVDYKGNTVASDDKHVTFTFPDPLQPGIEQIVEYTVKDDEGNTAQGTIKVILKDKTPTVTITGATEPIELLEKDDLYQYLDIVDYKGNTVASDDKHVIFAFPDSLQPGTEQIVEYTVKDDEGNTAQGTIKVILKDKTPTVTITGAMEPIELLEKDDLYQYLDIVDYKGNKVPSNATYVTFTFPDPLQPGTEQIVEYTVKDDEGNTAQGTVKVILKDKTPTVTITGATEPIEIAKKDDLYQYLDIVDYKGNKVPSNATYVTFDFPDLMQEGQEYIVPYTIKDTEGNMVKGSVRVKVKVKRPQVEIVGSSEPIVIEEKDDLYQYLQITDYKGNQVPSDHVHVKFDFLQGPLQPGIEYDIPYEVVDDEGNTAQGMIKVIWKDKAPTVSVVGGVGTIGIYNQEDLYSYLQIIDYKGNPVPSDVNHVKFHFPSSMLIGKVYDVSYEVVDDQGNVAKGILKVVMKDKSPIVIHDAPNDIIEIEHEKDLYQYLQFIDYKGNVIPFDEDHVKFMFPSDMEPGKEYTVSYEVIDDEGNKTKGTLKIRKKEKEDIENTVPEDRPSQGNTEHKPDNQVIESVNTGDESKRHQAVFGIFVSGMMIAIYCIYSIFSKKEENE